MEQLAHWSQRLKRERLLRGLSQGNLASKCGCDTKTVNRWEKGTSYPSAYNIQQLMLLFKKNAEELGLIEGNLLSTPASSVKPLEPVGSDDPWVLTKRENWDGTVSKDHFYGRAEAMTTLEQWIVDKENNIVVVLGLGGIGKTTFVRQLAERMKGDFDCVFWRSLENAPPVEDVLDAWLQFLSSRPIEPPQSLEPRISLLIAALRARRCLFILDNVESILQTGQSAGAYLDEHKGYGTLIQRVGETQHQSCFLLTSRETPGNVTRLEATTASVRSFALHGLKVEAGQKLLAERHLRGSEAVWQTFIEHYSGNPLALKLIAASIRDLFDGDIAAFLDEGETVFGEVRHLLAQQFQRTSELEKSVLLWLALEREAVPRSILRKDILQPISKGALTETIDGLLRRSLIETAAANSLRLQPVVMEYLTGYILDTAYRECELGVLDLLGTHALAKAQGRDYMRTNQARLFLIPIVERLITAFGQEESEQKLKGLLSTLSRNHRLASGYAAGNILNLLVYLGADLRGIDCSQLTIRQATLRGVELPAASFKQANFDSCTFTDTFMSIQGIAVSSDGQRLATGTTTGEICVWNVADASLLLTCAGHSEGVRAVAFSPDAQVFASASEDHTVRLWESQTGLCQHILEGHTAWVRSVTFHPDQKLIASAGDDQAIRVWNTQTGKLTQLLKGHQTPIRTLAFHPTNALLVSGGDDGMLYVWDVFTGVFVRKFQAHAQSLRTLAFNFDGTMLATGSEDRTVQLWDFATDKNLASFKGHTSRVRTLAFCSDGRILASGSDDQMIYVWDIQQKQHTHIIQGHTSRIWSLAFVPDSHILISASEDDTLRWWQTDTEDCLKNLRGYTNLIKSVAWSPDGTMIASGSEDRAVRLWNVLSGKCVKILHGHLNRIRSVAWSPEGTIVASGSEDERVRLWDALTGQPLLVLQGHKHLVRCVVFSPDGHLLASGSYDGTIRIWDIYQKYYQCVLSAQQGGIWSIAFSPDGQLIAASGDELTIRIWNVATGTLHLVLQGHQQGVWSIAWSKDGKRLASSSDDGTLRVWDALSGTCVLVLEGHKSWIRSVDFTPDGRIVASGSYDQTIRLWDSESGNCLRTIAGHEGWIGSVAFSPNGQALASGSDDGTVRIWDVEQSAWQRILKLEGPYENMDITGAQGLSEGQKLALRKLGAIDKSFT